MDNDSAASLDRAISKIDTGRLKSGRDEMFTVLNQCQDPIGKIVTAYNLGTTFWARIGNGEKAHEFFKNAVEEAEKVGVEEVTQALPSLVADAYENLMHLSHTFDEYFAWAEKLRSLQPTDDVLRGMVPQIKEAQESGTPWSLQLEELARYCYDRRDPSQDRGEYARVVSTYHLILVNRKAMRLAREAWSRIIYEYGTLSLRVASDAMETMKHSQQSPNPSEFSFVVQDAKAFVDEYFSANPSNTEVRFLIDNMDGFLRKVDNIKEEYSVAILNQEGLDFLDRREFQQALAKFTKAENICRETGDQEKLQTCLGNLVLAVNNIGDSQRALELVTEKEDICRTLNLYSSLANALLMKASILDLVHRTRDAIKTAEEANRLCEKYGLGQIGQKVQMLLMKLRSSHEREEEMNFDNPMPTVWVKEIEHLVQTSNETALKTEYQESGVALDVNWAVLELAKLGPKACYAAIQNTYRIHDEMLCVTVVGDLIDGMRDPGQADWEVIQYLRDFLNTKSIGIASVS